MRFPGRIRRLVVAGVGSNLFRPENGDLVCNALRANDERDIVPALRSLVMEVRRSGNDLDSLAAIICRPPRLPTPADLLAVKAKVLLIAGTVTK